MMNTHFRHMALGQHTAQVNAVRQPPSWCEICSGSDHSAKIRDANPDFVNFIRNAQREGVQ